MSDPDDIERIREEAKQAGRREVVEWIEKELLLYDPDYDDKAKWQAKLKEWGL